MRDVYKSRQAARLGATMVRNSPPIAADGVGGVTPKAGDPRLKWRRGGVWRDRCSLSECLVPTKANQPRGWDAKPPVWE